MSDHDGVEQVITMAWRAHLALEPTSMSDFQNRIVGVVGRKGSGKSTRTSTLLKYVPRIFAWDPMADHQDLLLDRFEHVDVNLDDYFAEASQSDTFACAYTAGNDLESDFEEICQLVYGCGHLLFVVEEAPLVCRASYMPATFGKIVRTGRHRAIDLLWTAQRASEVARSLTSSTDIWIFYSQTEPRDLDSIAERCGRDIAEKVAGLGLHDSFFWDAIGRSEIASSPRLLKRDLARVNDLPAAHLHSKS
jgi:energy-coupling factor transporter ATP-binding protein EcfA2